jgi:F-type H+-transporting ATPase subunit delta
MIEKLAEHPTVFDADQQQLGSVYAKALLGHGRQIGKLDQLVEQLEQVAVAIREVPGWKGVLESPRVPESAKSAMIDKAFGGKVDPVLLHFLKVVNSKGRFECLEAISVNARKMQDEMAGRVQAVLTSATEMDAQALEGISRRLAQLLGKEVSLKTVVDPSIIGGITVRVGDTVYDASLKNQLAQVRARAVQRASDAIREKLDRFIVN